MIGAWPTATTEVAPGVFAYVQEGGGFCVANAGIVRGPRGATVIDALFTPPMTRALLGEVQRVAGAAPERLINTHHHVDHTLGNALFPPEATVVAHSRARAEMERTGMGVLRIIERMAPYFGPDLAGAAERLPDATFDGDTLSIDIGGGRELRLLHFGTAHTRGDIVALLPAERVAFLGDAGFFYVTPMAHEGHIGNWIRVCKRIIDELPADVLVPGHGPVGTKDDLATFSGYLERIRDGSRAAFDAGVTADEAVASIELGEYAAWGESAERIGINVARLYAEFRGELKHWLA